MAPRKPVGDKAMTSAERVALSRWVNKVEAAADELLNLLVTAPQPLPRAPVIHPELVDRLAQFNLDQDDQQEEDFPPMRFLKLGNGNQVVNKRRALACTLRFMDGAKRIDRRTIELPEFGTCHFSAYTHPKGAMISTPNREDDSFGSVDWHSRDHIILFRDVGDGRCIIYISEIEPLFALRTIGQHGVTWDAVSGASKKAVVLSSKDALDGEELAA